MEEIYFISSTPNKKKPQRMRIQSDKLKVVGLKKERKKKMSGNVYYGPSGSEYNDR